MDSSSYISIENKLNCSLTFVNKGTESGYWQQNPPQTISANATSSEFQVKDKFGKFPSQPRRRRTHADGHAGLFGSEGWVQYKVDLPDAANDDAKPIVQLNFCCPCGTKDNTFSAVAKANSDPSAVDCHLFQFKESSYNKRDHPLKVTVTVSFNTGLTTRSTVLSIRVPRAVTPVRNTQGMVHLGNNLTIWEAQAAGQYEDNSDPRCAGSLFPVAVDVGDSSMRARGLELTVEIDEQLAGVPLTVQGGNDATPAVAGSRGGVVLQFARAGQYRVQVEVDPPWASATSPWGVSGNIAWRLLVAPTGQALALNATRLEFYALAGRLPRFLAQGVPVALARRAVPTSDALGEAWLERCYNNVFQRFGACYDAVRGRPAYVSSWTGGSLRLRAFLADAGGAPLVNCYDQAAILQVCLALAPAAADARWALMRNFGFIKTTNLVGRGACNNPFFLSSGAAPGKQCDNDDPRRTAFGNHAFLLLGERVVDATCSPHVATEDHAAYVRAAIQTADETRLYRLKNMAPGTVADLFECPGVSDLDGAGGAARHGAARSAPLDLDAPARRLLDLARPRAELVPRFCNADIRAAFAPADRDGSGDGGSARAPAWHVVRSDVYLAPAATLAEWVLRDADGRELSVECTVAADEVQASERFADHLQAHSAQLDSVFGPPERRRRGCGLSLAGAVGSPCPASLWVFGNVFVSVAARAPAAAPPRLRHRGHEGQDDDEGERQGDDDPAAAAAAVDAASDALFRHLDRATVDSADDALEPAILDVSCPDEVRVGDTFIVRVSADGGRPLVDVRSQEGNIILLESNDKLLTYKFAALAAGADEICFSFAHAVSLRPAGRVHRITVRDE
ncbi:hypothetical protein B0J12DRAFT_59179 [Macrophomina phaseolina]|uniref:Uncharacterized protein n=1 Tax=Macrophomina phaseolina TaxID=35725 RepID=A0ABQ8FRC0_9PEZI|nr:hypothetical protein B0J12DRAFT_59179 [Macrophomina phaseolina]